MLSLCYLMLSCKMISYATKQCEVLSNNMVQCGVMWCSVVWCDVVWCGVVHLSDGITTDDVILRSTSQKYHIDNMDVC